MTDTAVAILYLRWW